MHFLRKLIPAVLILTAISFADEAVKEKPKLPVVEKDGYKLEINSVNWTGTVQLPGGQTQWQAAIGGTLTGPPDRGVVAYTMEVREAVDGKGRSLLPSDFQRRWTTERQQRSNQVFRLIGRRSANAAPGELGGVSVALAGAGHVAGTIASLKGSLYVLEVEKSAEVQVLLDEQGQKNWSSYSETIKFRLEKMEQRGNQVTVHLAHTLEDHSIIGEDLTRPPYVFGVAPLDAEGNELPLHVAPFNPRGQGQFIVTLFSQTGEAAKPARLRLRIAEEVIERKVDFELKDIDLGVAPAAKDKP